jgi:hypothetical protein
MVLVAERRDREVDRRHTPILTRLRLGVFDRPARIPVFLRELRRLVLPVGGNLAFLDRLLLFDRVALFASPRSWRRQSGRSSLGSLLTGAPRQSAGTGYQWRRPSSAPRGTSRSCWRLERYRPILARGSA